MALQILRSVVGRLMGLGPANELILAGKKIVFDHGTNLDPTLRLDAAPSVFMQMGGPLILVSSGSMANNGALSGLTALQATFGQFWACLPAGAIFAGSLAGTYYAQGSSATAAQVFQDQPVLVGNSIPFQTNPKPWVSTGPGAFTQTSGSNITALAVTLPGNSMGLMGYVTMKGGFSNNNSAGAKLGQIGFGSLGLPGASNTTNQSQPISHDIVNMGNVATQAAIGGSGYVVSAAAPSRSAVDTSAPVTLSFFLQVAVATDTCQWDYLMVELHPSTIVP